MALVTFDEILILWIYLLVPINFKTAPSGLIGVLLLTYILKCEANTKLIYKNWQTPVKCQKFTLNFRLPIFEHTKRVGSFLQWNSEQDIKFEKFGKSNHRIKINIFECHAWTQSITYHLYNWLYQKLNLYVNKL